MARQTPAAVPGGFSRRWHIPPPLVHGPETLEGAAVLGEIPGAPGLLLWQSARDVSLWSRTAPGERDGLFADRAATARARALRHAEPEELRAPLTVLARVLGGGGAVEPGVVAEACSAVAAWAEARGALATALAYAQNAALVQGDRAAPALAVARLASRRGDHARAELWFRRATGIARRARDWRQYARAFSGLASLYRDRGNLPAAHRFHLRALRGARRGGLRIERAVALHDLFGISVEAGRTREAQRYAREAFAAYPPRSPRLAALAHDVAYFWMEEGEFARALPLLQAVEPLVTRPEETLWVAADLVRAAAGAGEVAFARTTADRVRELCARPALAAAAARAQLELARGELHLGRMEAAEEAASAALERARTNREGRTVLTAEALLDAIRAGRAAAGQPDARTPREKPRSATMADDRLAAELLQSLQTLGPPVDGDRAAGPQP